MTKKAARQYGTEGYGRDHAESYDTDRKRVWKDKSGAKKSFTRRSAIRLDEEISPVQAYVKNEGSFSHKAGNPAGGQRHPKPLAPRHSKTPVVPGVGGQDS